MSNKRLYKSTVNCMLCGVCGGIAEYFDIDPTLVRLAWVILTCSAAQETGHILLQRLLFRKHKKNRTRSTACENLAARVFPGCLVIVDSQLGRILRQFA